MSTEVIKANVFDIQRYSIHDGPGIRTTVFLKGCPLRCRWCANPESWGKEPRLFFLESRCIGCLSCAAASKNGEVTACEGRPLIHWELCQKEAVQRLAAACPADALLVKGIPMSVQEVFEEIQKDLPFYQRSGGGVTLSGGEPLLHPDFVRELLKLCQRANIHTAVETTGLVPYHTFEQLEGLVDLYLYDFKHPDSESHKAWTGCGNEQILENLVRLSRTKARLHVRVPVIPGVNDDPSILARIAAFLNAHHIQERTLLPFHQYGSSKYRSCGLSYPMAQVPQLTKEALNSLAEASSFYTTGGLK